MNPDPKPYEQAENCLDDSLEMTFPASDPIALTPEKNNVAPANR
jgi:hypothetical protein